MLPGRLYPPSKLLIDEEYVGCILWVSEKIGMVSDVDFTNLVCLAAACLFLKCKWTHIMRAMHTGMHHALVLLRQ